MAQDGIEIEPDLSGSTPEIDDTDGFYITAFYDLSSERSLGEDLRPIPFSSIMSYAALLGMSFDDAEDLAFVIRMADNAYLADLIEKRKKEIEKSGKSKSSAVRKKNGRNAQTNRDWA